MCLDTFSSIPCQGGPIAADTAPWRPDQPRLDGVFLTDRWTYRNLTPHTPAASGYQGVAGNGAWQRSPWRPSLEKHPPFHFVSAPSQGRSPRMRICTCAATYTAPPIPISHQTQLFSSQFEDVNLWRSKNSPSVSQGVSQRLDELEMRLCECSVLPFTPLPLPSRWCCGC